jgi:hypothetical protein
VQVLAAHWRPLLSHLGVQHHAHGRRIRTHCQGDAEIADDRPHYVSLPSALGIAIPRSPAQADPRGVDRLLPERAESFSLERGASVPDLAAREELLQPIVNRTGEDHAAEDLAPLLDGKRRRDLLAREKAVAGVRQLRARRLDPRGRTDARCRFGQPSDREPDDASLQLAAERGALRPCRFERLLNNRNGERKALERECR